MTTVERIFALLTSRHIEQKELAAFLGVRGQTISDWKSGKTKSYKKYIEKIAEFFNVSVDYLLVTDSQSPLSMLPEDAAYGLYSGMEGFTDLPEDIKKIMIESLLKSAQNNLEIELKRRKNDNI